MDQIQTPEKLRFRKKKRSGSEHSLGNIFAPWFILILGLLLAILAMPLDRRPLADESFDPELDRNFGFMQQTENWLHASLALNSGSYNLDLSPRLSAFKSNKKFFPKRLQVSVIPTRTSLRQIAFSALGTNNPWQAYSDKNSIRGFDLDVKSLYAVLSSEVASELSRPAQNAVLEIVDDRAKTFVPHTIGQNLDIYNSLQAVKTALFSRQSETPLAVITTRPEVTLAQTNDLGIREIVASGVSDFSGSSQSRITNIRVGASRFHGVLLKPGQEFSFNEYLGPVTAAAGFRPELVIKSTGTIPELGGGLCQVSTTAFRAALYGGLPITARKNHSYAVKYYAPQGTDATIYPGAVDFKFINDTSAYLAIATHMEGNRLYFDFYGTPDGRQVAIDGPHHYDFGPGGAMKASLTRTVTQGTETLKDDFYSRYVSQNLFPVIYEYPTTPAPAAETPNTEEVVPEETNNVQPEPEQEPTQENS